MERLATDSRIAQIVVIVYRAGGSVSPPSTAHKLYGLKRGKDKQPIALKVLKKKRKRSSTMW